jgi:hypothetical protein
VYVHPGLVLVFAVLLLCSAGTTIVFGIGYRRLLRSFAANTAQVAEIVKQYAADTARWAEPRCACPPGDDTPPAADSERGPR